MLLHYLKLVIFVVTDDFFDDVLKGFDKVLEGHLVAVEFVSHDLDEYEVVVILGNPLVGHPLKL